MGLVKFAARLLMSGIYVYGGYSAFKEPGPRTKRLENVNLPESEILVKLNGAAMIGAGVTMGLGVFPRLSALTLFGALLPTTLAGHPFWKESDEKIRQQQTLQFCKNMGLLGGLLLVGFDQKPKKEVIVEIE